MNVSRENLGELDLCIRIDIEENDYKERVEKQLKNYQKEAIIPGFRKGKAPIGMIQRMYKPAVVADEVQNLMGETLYKYIEDEKLAIIGTPLNNDEKTGEIDFANQTSFTFYFDAAKTPEVNVAWDKVDVKLNQIKISSKDVDEQVDIITKRYGKFETPETIGDNGNVYGKVVELDKEGIAKEGGMSIFTSFDLAAIKDDAVKALFNGKKAEDKVVFNVAKAFTAADIEKIFRIEKEAAKKFKADVEFAISGCSVIIPHELNEEFFAMVYPGEEIKDAEQFRKRMQKEMERSNDEQCNIHYVNQVRKSLLENFDAQLPEAFLKRWILSRSDKDVNTESIEAEWNEKYVPGLKWELLDTEFNKVAKLEPSQDEVIEFVKGILYKNEKRGNDEEDEKAYNERMDQAARAIAADRNNVQQIYDKLYVEKTAKFFKEKLNPEIVKVTPKEFAESIKE